jgi:transaldolase/glucose-6-phosphate isomerase
MSEAKETDTQKDAIVALRSFGQSVWLDFIRRSFLAGGELKKLVDAGLGGVTSNPAIFEKAIGGSDDYAAAIAELASDPRLSPKRVFELLAVKDIQDAADILRPVYDRTAARDGYVSLEVAPDLATDTERTLQEARRLWAEVGRPNAMIKVPATPEGIVAFRQLIAEGINVNVTLLFDRGAYEAVAQAYIEGLAARVAAGKPVAAVASVASFFVSRIDAAVDALLAKKPEAKDLSGKIAIANAKLAYRSYERIFAGSAWEALKSAGAQTQRVLWASTGTKNPEYRDVVYVEELIGPDTVNTVPPETLAAFRDHGRASATLEARVDEAEAILARLETAGISLKAVTDELLIDGLKKFVDPFQKLMSTVEQRFREACERKHQKGT